MSEGKKQAVASAVQAYLDEQPEATWRDLYESVPNHYANQQSMRASLGNLIEKRIANVPAGVMTTAKQQEIIASDGRGITQGSPDAILVQSKKQLHGVPNWQRGESNYEAMAGSMRVGYDMQSRYLDYENMDDYSELSVALDIIADDATIVDASRKRMIWATGEDAMLRDVVEDLLYRILDVESDAWATIRTMGKYGNSVAEIVATKDGVMGLNYLPPAEMRKVIDHRGTVMGYVQSVTGNFVGLDTNKFNELMKERMQASGPNKEGLIVFAPWEIVWWQMPSKQVRAPYGVSVYDAARWAWKRLCMLEDTAVVYRLTRPPSRYVCYVDTQDMPPQQATAYMQQVKQQWKKKRVIDPATGQIDFRANLMANDEEIFVPVRGGREASRIEVLNGPDFNIIDDLEFFRQKLFSSIGIPKSYFGLADETTRANLSQLDIMFARREMRIQRMYMVGLMQVVRLHLALLDIDPDANQVGLDMTVPSSILEMSQIETGNARAAYAQGIENYYDRHTILTKVFGETDQDADDIVRAKRKEGMNDAEAQGEAQANAMRQMPQPEGDDEEATQDAPVSAEEMQFALRRLERVISERTDRVQREVRQVQQEARRMPRALQRLEARLARTQVIQERKNRVV